MQTCTMSRTTGFLIQVKEGGKAIKKMSISKPFVLGNDGQTWQGIN